MYVCDVLSAKHIHLKGTSTTYNLNRNTNTYRTGISLGGTDNRRFRNSSVSNHSTDINHTQSHLLRLCDNNHTKIYQQQKNYNYLWNKINLAHKYTHAHIRYTDTEYTYTHSCVCIYIHIYILNRYLPFHNFWIPHTQVRLIENGYVNYVYIYM